MHNLKAILWTRATRPVELALSLFTLAFGLPVLLSQNHSLTQYKSFNALLQHGTKITWGILVCTVGMIQVASLVVDRFWARRAASFIGAWLWFGIFCLYLLSGELGPNLFTFAVRTAVYLWVLWRMGMK